MTEEKALSKVEPTGIQPAKLIDDIPAMVQKIIEETSLEIQGNKYIRVEGWQSFAKLDGKYCSIEDVKMNNLGVSAKAVLKDGLGTRLAEATGFVGNDEPSWANRPLYARISMAQTRAISKVCRDNYSYLVVLLGSDYKPTPAEEMEGMPTIDVEPVPAPAPAPAPAPSPAAPTPAPTQGYQRQYPAQKPVQTVMPAENQEAWMDFKFPIKLPKQPEMQGQTLWNIYNMEGGLKTLAYWRDNFEVKPGKYAAANQKFRDALDQYAVWRAHEKAQKLAAECDQAQADLEAKDAERMAAINEKSQPEEADGIPF